MCTAVNFHISKVVHLKEFFEEEPVKESGNLHTYYMLHILYVKPTNERFIIPLISYYSIHYYYTHFIF